MSQPLRWRLRNASDADREFLFDLHCTTMRDVIESTWGWDDVWQRSDFDRRLQMCSVSIIEIDGQPGGAVWIESMEDSIHIVELQLLPAQQGRGIGTAVIQDLIREASARNLAVTLSAVPANPRAMGLYERLGFEVTGFEAPYIHMRHRR